MPQIAPLFSGNLPLFFSDFAPKLGLFSSLFAQKTSAQEDDYFVESPLFFAIFHLKTASFLPDSARERNARFLPVFLFSLLVWSPPPNCSQKPIKAQKEHILDIYSMLMLNNCKVLKNTLINPYV